MKHEYYIIKLKPVKLKYIYRTKPNRKYLEYYQEGSKRWIYTNMTCDFLEKHYSGYKVSETDVFLELL